MAKLPTAQDLGGIPNIVSPRAPVARVDTRALSAGNKAAARAISGVGDAAMSLHGKFKSEEDKTAQYQTELALQEFEFAQREQFKTVQDELPPGGIDNFEAHVQKVYQDNAKTFFKSIPESQKQRADLRLFGLERDLSLAAQRFQKEEGRRVSKRNFATATEGVLATRAADAKTDTDLQQVLLDQQKILDNDHRLNDREKDALGRAGRKRLTLANVQAKDPNDRKAWVKRVRGARSGKLVNYESGGNPKAFNQFGFAGKYQVGAPRLSTIGVYKPGGGENLRGWNSATADAEGKWSGEFNIPGFPKVKTLQDFLGNEKAQDKVHKLHIQDIDKFAKKNGLDQYIGQTVGGVTITKEGMRNMAHLGGSGGMKRFLESGGEYNPADANGTRLSTYAALGVGGAGTDFTEAELRKISDEATKEAVAIEKKQKLEADKLAEETHKQAVDQLYSDVFDRKADESTITAARDKGFFKSHREFEAALKYAKDIADGERDTQVLQDIINGKVPYNDGDKAHKKAVNDAYDKTDTNERLSQKDEAAADGVVKLFDDLNTLPSSAAGTLTHMLRSQDKETSVFALQTLDRMRRTSQGAFDSAFPKHVQRKVDFFATQGKYLTPDEFMSRLKDMNDPVLESVRKDRRAAADTITKDIAPADVIEKMDLDTITEFSDPEVAPTLTSLSGDVQNAIAREYKDLFREEYAENGGNAELAETMALKQLRTVWQRSDITGNAKIMRYPPEAVLPDIEGSHDWVKKEFNREMARVFTQAPETSMRVGSSSTGAAPMAKLPDNLSLVPVPRFNPKEPAWHVVFTDENGQVQVMADSAGRPHVQTFEVTPHIEALVTKYRKMRANPISPETTDLIYR